MPTANYAPEKGLGFLILPQGQDIGPTMDHIETSQLWVKMSLGFLCPNARMRGCLFFTWAIFIMIIIFYICTPTKKSCTEHSCTKKREAAGQLSDGMQSTKNGSLGGRVEIRERADGRAVRHVLDDAGYECGRPQWDRCPSDHR